MKNRNEAYMRAKKMLLNNNDISPEILGVLRADIATLLNGYFDFSANSLTIDVVLSKDNRYNLIIEADVDRIKAVKIL